MKRSVLLVLSALLLHCICLAQEPDEDFRKFANAKIPVSMQNFDFFETFGTFSLRQLDFQSETLSPLSFKVSFYRNYKEVDSLSLIFYSETEEAINRAQVKTMVIRFKSAAGCANYLKLLGAPVSGNRWDFNMKGEHACKGVQIFKQNNQTIRIQTVSECGG
jgi:hypothetical protein